MSNRNTQMSVTLSIAVLLLGAIPALAASIGVANHDFEDAGFADGGLGSAFPSWTASVNAGQGTFNPNTGHVHYTAMGDGDPNAGVLANMDGPSFGFLRPNGVGVAVEATQTLTDTLLADTKYTLTVAFGTRNLFNTAQSMKDITLTLRTSGGTIIAQTLVDQDNSGTSTTWTQSTFTEVMAMGTTGAAPTGLGETLVISIAGSTAGRYLDFDNVRLDATSTATVPAPAASVAGAVMLTLLGARRRR